MENLIRSVELSLDHKNWYSALTLALILPDIAGKIEFTNLSSGKRYAQWFENYMIDNYKSNIGPDRTEHIFLSGNDCYALRCAYLHEGKSNISGQRASDVLEDFEFLIPPKGSTIHKNQLNNKLQLQVDIFCRDILNGINKWLEDVYCDTEKQNKLSGFLKLFELK